MKRCCWTYCFIIICSVILTFPVFSQHAIEVSLGIGGTSYQGDISHLSTRISFQGTKPLRAAKLGYRFSDFYVLYVSYLSTSIAASDKSSLDGWRKSRNLSFRTPINEWSLVHEISPFEGISIFNSLDVKPYFLFGLSYFKFNPQSNYKGTWIDLHPLSTEGQGLGSQYPEPYKLKQWAIPIGVGLKYVYNNGFFVSFDITPRITFTDYLDDVSNQYPDFDQLIKNRGEIAAEMSYQGDKLPRGLPREELQTKGRGNPNDNDSYVTYMLSFGYSWDYMHTIKRNKAFKYGRKCSHFFR